MAGARHPLRPGARYILVYEGPISNLNRDRNHHWAKRHPRDEETKGEARNLALVAKLPRANRISVSAQPIQRGGNKADALAVTETTKAFIDGLVLAKVIPDDSEEYLRQVSQRPTMWADRDGIIFTINVIC